jgi:hypothetical protein
VYQVSWPDIEKCEAKTPVMLTDTCFGVNNNGANFNPLQYELQQLSSAGISNVTFTLSRTPQWAVRHASGQVLERCSPKSSTVGLNPQNSAFWSESLGLRAAS